MTIAQALRDAAQQLASVSDTARLDGELLMAHAFGVPRSALLLRHMGDPVPASFQALVERRERHEPVAYIIGRQEFFGLGLEVDASVLIPRHDSETIIEAAQTSFAGRPPAQVLDLGTGSGALLLAALSVWPQAQGLGIDCDAAALAIARRNAVRVGINPHPPGEATGDMSAGQVENAPRAMFALLDWRRLEWQEQLSRFDLIVANPPYVETAADLSPSVRQWEPAGALFAGQEGLDDYLLLIPQLPHLLRPDGRAVLEIGHTQADAVRAIAQDARFDVDIVKDLGGRPRAAVLAIKGWQTASE